MYTEPGNSSGAHRPSGTTLSGRCCRRGKLCCNACTNVVTCGRSSLGQRMSISWRPSKARNLSKLWSWLRTKPSSSGVPLIGKMNDMSPSWVTFKDLQRQHELCIPLYDCDLINMACPLQWKVKKGALMEKYDVHEGAYQCVEGKLWTLVLQRCATGKNCQLPSCSCKSEYFQAELQQTRTLKLRSQMLLI